MTTAHPRAGAVADPVGRGDTVSTVGPTVAVPGLPVPLPEAAGESPSSLPTWWETFSAYTRHRAARSAPSPSSVLACT